MTSTNVHPFLLSLLRGTGEQAPLPSSREDQAWERIISDADRHALLPFLYRWLRRFAWDSQLPPHLHEQLKERVFGLAARNLILAQELATILRAFEAKGLACMPLRGLALAQQLYGDVTARPMGDIDLLVRRAALPKAAGILGTLGYAEMDRRPGFAQAFSYTLEFVKDLHGWVTVEPHWTIAYPPFAHRIDMDAVWQRCTRGHVAGIETWLLGREELLLHLCFHLIHREDSAPLLWLYELDHLIRREADSLNWTRIVLIARQSGQALLVATVMERLKSSFDSPVPDQVVSQLVEPAERGGGRLVGRSLQQRVVGLFVKDGRLDGRESFALFFSIHGVRAKLRYASAMLIPSPEFMRLHYGLTSRRQLGIWYLRRLGSLAWESLKGIVGLILPHRPSEHVPHP